MKIDRNPPVGLYDTDRAYSFTKSKSVAVFIKKPMYKEASRSFYPKETGPEVYDGHLKPFGADAGKITLGGKYKTEINSNPPPGAYDIERADSVVKYRSPGASIKEDSRNSFSNKGISRMVIT